MSEHQSFYSALAESDLHRARFDAVVERVQSDARDLLGIEVTADEVANLSAARLAVLTDEPLSAFTWADELRSIESVKERARQAHLRQALEAGEEEAHAELRRLTPTERMTRARELGLTGSTGQADEQKETSAADEAVLIRRLLELSPAERIAKGRAWGIIK